MDVPKYSSVEVMTEKVLIAARLCGEIDDDGEYLNDDDSYGGGARSDYVGEENKMDDANLNLIEMHDYE